MNDPPEHLAFSESAAPAAAPWEFAGLLLTYWCSSQCAFCYVCAGPGHDHDMSIQTALMLWRGLDELAAAHGTTMRVHLAGGEPFRNWVRLVSLIRAARDAGLTPVEKIETNAFWATDDGLTRARIELLDALGVQRLVVSTDVFHQEFVPFECVRRCVETARRVLGRGRVIVRWLDFYQDPVDIARMSAAEKVQAFQTALARHPDRLTGRAAARLAPLLPGRPAAAFAGERCVDALLHGRHVHIDPDGYVFPGTCAGIVLGRATGGDVAGVWRKFAARWHDNPVIAALVSGGSYELLQQAMQFGYVELASGYASKCHLCAHIRRFFAGRGLWPEYVGPAHCYEGATP